MVECGRVRNQICQIPQLYRTLPAFFKRTMLTSAMDPVAQGPFSASLAAPATILVSSPVVALSLELPHQRGLTNQLIL